ncbi:MAG TPA: glutathione synthetase [Candidatus Krumholzibacteria bacterium]|nr:glutathione synthetase [Candidatus Krumholzibacteria bacterium]HPD73243.1 glutathione synthetase [Candidatus Krumholzibacteria bacterium]HRY40205.1 glutathione synthetase [Candidatus Krumholzibacteria bacterium]
MNICFLMYPWERIVPETDTSLRLIHECAGRGHRVALTTPGDLTIRDNVAHAFCRVIQNNRISGNIPSFYRHVDFTRNKLPLSGFDVIVMRAPQPLDTVVLNFLDSVRADTFILNDIDGLRIANNKLYTTAFNDPDHDFVPVTHVSKNKEYLERIFRESVHEKMILKPLNGHGGRGVILIEKRARQSFRSLLDFYIGEGPGSHYVILQEYIPGAEQGDVRILMLNGEPIGAMRRVPAADDNRSNVHAGGSVRKHLLSRQEKALCKHIGPKLVRDGLFFAGLDVIGGKLIEVNVLAPGGITRINRLNRVRLQIQIVDFIESVVQARERIINRKNEYRKLIEKAHTA